MGDSSIISRIQLIATVSQIESQIGQETMKIDWEIDERATGKPEVHWHASTDTVAAH
jgi:hypothetical protein